MTSANYARLIKLIAPDCPTAKKIAQYARSKGLQPHDADDVAQETALRCLGYAKKHPNRLHGESTVVGIAKHCVMNEHRRRRQKRFALTSFRLEEIAKPASREATEPPTREEVVQKLDRFAARTREIAVRRLIDRESVAEIAADMQMTQAAVRSRLDRVRIAFIAPVQNCG
jgi:RNA polymerase sigma factor (sigma-70 family)